LGEKYDYFLTFMALMHVCWKSYYWY